MGRLALSCALLVCGLMILGCPRDEVAAVEDDVPGVCNDDKTAIVEPGTGALLEDCVGNFVCWMKDGAGICVPGSSSGPDAVAGIDVVDPGCSPPCEDGECTAFACVSGECVYQGPQPGWCWIEDDTPGSGSEKVCYADGKRDPADPCWICDSAEDGEGWTAADDGVECDDEDACTQFDTCQSGMCVGSDPIACESSDQCHQAGTCDPASGVCDDPPKADSSGCDDGNACTQVDSCWSGECVPGEPVICEASDQCHDVGTCDSATGLCSDPAKADGAGCDDDDACTQTDTCVSGVCKGAEPMTCTSDTECQVAGACDPASGCPALTPAEDGASCTVDADDGLDCTEGQCSSGACGDALSDGHCLIEVEDGDGNTVATCFAAGDPNPANPCQKCDPTADTAAWAAIGDDAECDDGDACTQSDSCVSGVCEGADPVECAAKGQCHDAGTCNSTTGVCDDPAKADGEGCDDGDACTQTDTCQSGACEGASPVECVAKDQCHDAGTCDSGTGICTDPAKADGAGCDDGDACTQFDTCQSGICEGADPVVCTGEDQCHDGGNCDPTSGLCSGPAKADGTGCDDGDACTQTDTCQSGTCEGASPVVCAAKDQCHDAGTCDSATGVCSDPAKADGTGCDDGDACTQTDTCQSGACEGASPVVCAAKDQCHDAGGCDSATGVCSDPAKADGVGCDDGDACTQTDACQSGACEGAGPVVCSAKDQCHDAGSCDSATGVCSDPAKTDGAGCDDGDACTQTDTCQSGACEGASPVVCAAKDPCHDAGTCDADSGVCSDPAKQDGTACDDDDACTTDDQCETGVCTGGLPPGCDDSNACTEESCDTVGGCSSAPISAAGVPGDGVLWLPLELIDGGGSPDASGGGNDATLVGIEAGDHVPGEVGQGLDVDLEHYLTVPSPGFGSGSFTVAAWIKTTETSFPQPRRIFSQQVDQGLATGWFCRLDEQGELSFGGVGGVAGDNFDDREAINDGEWHHVACIRDVDASVQQVVVDGAVQWERALSSAAAIDQSDPVVIGRCFGCNAASPKDEPLAMQIDEVVFYKRAVTFAGPGLVLAPSLPVDDPCNDGVACTIDSCDPASGCVHLLDASLCEDGNSCTDDICTATGCSNPSTGLGCDDGSECTKDDACNGAGQCEGTALTAEDCTDNNECTVDSCPDVAGCVHLDLADDTQCSDGDPCTLDDTCQTGACASGSPKCDDDSVCTTDNCAADGTCTFAPIPCDDQDPCTVDSCDPFAGCTSSSGAVTIDDFARADGTDVGDGWVEHSAEWAIASGEAKLTGPGSSTWGTMSKEIGWRSTFDIRVTFRTSGGEPVVAVNADGGPYGQDRHFVGGLAARFGGDGKLYLSRDESSWVNLASTPYVPEVGVDHYLRLTYDGQTFGATVWKTSASQPGSPTVSAAAENLPSTYTELVLSADHPVEVFYDDILDLALAGCDRDHDGVQGADDTCPTVWNPDNDPAICPPMGANWKAKRALGIAQPDTIDGASTWRRTHEPVEVPLVNGILDSSVAGYWPFDGGKALDQSGNGLNGQTNGAPAGVGAFGDVDGSLEFDGAGAGVLVTGSESLGVGKTQLTVMAWVRPSADGPAGTILHKTWADGESSYFIRFDNQSVYVAVSVVPTKSISLDALPNAVPNDQWSHVALAFDGTTLRVFVNGQLSGAGSANGTIQAGPDALPLGIGYRPTGSDGTGIQHPFDGWIDEVIVLERSASASEIAAYARSKMPYGTSLFPGAQADFDDVRIVETSAEHGTVTVPHEVVGVRPHSDTDSDGVSGYWPLGGGALGRFGDPSGATDFDGVDDELDLSASGLDHELTIELWLRPSADLAAGVSRQDLVHGKTSSGDVAVALYYHNQGTLTFGVGGDMVKSGVLTLSGGRWAHVAARRSAPGQLDLWVDGVRLTTSTVTTGGAEDAIPEISDLKLGRSSTGTNYLNGTVDDLVIHSVARSADYLRNRARGLPAVRFLGHTERLANADGAYDWMQYDVHWLNPAATHSRPVLTALDGSTKCTGLLSSCIGYAGWWRFDDGTLDSSTAGRHAVSAAGAVTLPSKYGTALDIQETSDLTVDPFPSWSLGAAVTVETLVKSTSFVPAGTVVANVGPCPQFQLYLKQGAPALYSTSSDTAGCGEGFGGVADSVPCASGEWCAVGVVSSLGSSGALYSAHSPLGTDWTGSATLAAGGKLGIGYRPGEGQVLSGALDEVRISSRALATDEHLHHPLGSWSLGALTDPSGDPLDQDGDAIPDDGDGSGVVGDNPCTGGATTGCDDNCVGALNADQADMDVDGVGDACDATPCGSCDDGLFCTIDTCNPDSGCVNRWAPLCDTGDLALNHSAPSSGDGLTTGGWTPNGGGGESITYSSEQPYGGSLGLRTYGNNGAGMSHVLDSGVSSYTVEVWYRAGGAYGDSFQIKAPDGAEVLIRTTGYCGGPSQFSFDVSEPAGSVSKVVIDGAPAFVAGAWYRFRINVDGAAVQFDVTDGATTGTATAAMAQAHSFDTVHFTVDCCGGCSHVAYWDDFRMWWPDAPLSDWKASRALNLFEPKHEVSDATKPSPPASLTKMQHAGGGSTWQRTAEPVEIPLVNGVLDDSLVAYWKLDGDAKDSVLPADHGTVTGEQAVTGVFGDANGAFSFGGSGGVQVPVSERLKWSANDSFTMMAWCRSSGIQMMCLSAEGSSNASVYLYVVDGTHASFYVRGNGNSGTGDFVKVGPGFGDGEWHHLAGVRDAAAGVIRLYVDGLLAAAPTLENEGEITEHTVIRIGREGYQGSADDAMVFNRVLSAAEIAAYARSLRPYGTSMVPGAQPNFRDVRVSLDGAVIPSEQLGVVPHGRHASVTGGVVLYLPMDGDAQDWSGANRDGALQGASPPQSVDGRFGAEGGAFQFTTADDRIEIPVQSPQPDVSKGFTIEAWIKPSVDNGPGAIIDGRTSSAGGLYLNTAVSEAGAEALYCNFRNSSGSDKSASVSGNFYTKNQWHHVACTYDLSTFRLYVDGHEVHSAASGGVPAWGTGVTPVGTYHDKSSFTQFDGAIDELVIHDTARAAAYLRDRASGLPRVRFLARTAPAADAGGRYAWADYRLHWKNPAANYVRPLAPDPNGGPSCDGLLSPCNGYVGWWRFDLPAALGFDSAMGRHHAAAYGTLATGPGIEGGAIVMDGSPSGLLVPYHSDLDLSAFNVEAAVIAQTQEATLAAKGSVGSNDAYNYYLGLAPSGAALAHYELPNDENVTLESQPFLPAQGWASLAASWEDSVLSLAIDGASHATMTGGAPGTNAFGLAIGSMFDDSGPLKYHFSGSLDSLRIMNRALPPAELLHFPLASWNPGPVVGAPVSCNVDCPPLSGFTAACNTKNHCEYTRDSLTEAWHADDVWIWVPPGSFEIGDDAAPNWGTPGVAVSIAYGYWIAKTEQTVPQYEACQAAGVCTAPGVADGNTPLGWGVNTSAGGRADHPQNGIDWQQSADLCGWLSSRGRLPSEAEWEWAAAGASDPMYPWGDSPAPDCDHGNHALGTGQYGCDPAGKVGTIPAGTLPAGASAVGALDMAGNLSEWVADCWHVSHTGAPTDGSAWLSDCQLLNGGVDDKVVKGGDHSHLSNYMQIASREGQDAPYQRTNLGVRCVIADVGADGVPLAMDDWPSHRTIALMEPTHETGDGSTPSPAKHITTPQNAVGASTWARAREPVELSLVNGILDRSVVGY